VGPTWADLLERWALIDADLHQVYNLDVWDEALMTSRPWAWLKTRILGLLSENTRLARSLAPSLDVPHLRAI
jgi:hypothetical protein